MIVDMFLTHTINGAFGEGWLGKGGIVIGMDDVMSYNSNAHRLDTIAHELGHNFGLDHWSGNVFANYLMDEGSFRNIPRSLGDISPDGPYDWLSPDEITHALTSGLLHDVSSTPEPPTTSIPEPASMILMATGVLGLIGTLCRRKA